MREGRLHENAVKSGRPYARANALVEYRLRSGLPGNLAHWNPPMEAASQKVLEQVRTTAALALPGNACGFIRSVIEGCRSKSASPTFCSCYGNALADSSPQKN